MNGTDTLFVSGILAIHGVLYIYGEWYWRVGKGKAKKLARAARRRR